MPWRESIDLPNVGHQNPIPYASKAGNMFYSSLISGRDAETGKLPDTMEDQARNCFKNLSAALKLAGGTLDDVVHVAVSVKAEDGRQKLNPIWLEAFPDAHSRPARHTSFDPSMNAQISIEVIAVLQNA